MRPLPCSRALRTLLATAGLLSLATIAAPSEGRDAAATPQPERSAEELIEQHCTRCHLAPDPRDLSREYWSFALHYMGNYVGMKGDEFEDMTVSPVPPDWEPQQDYTKALLAAVPDIEKGLASRGAQ